MGSYCQCLHSRTEWEKRRRREETGWRGGRDKAKRPTKVRWTQGKKMRGGNGHKRVWQIKVACFVLLLCRLLQEQCRAQGLDKELL